MDVSHPDIQLALTLETYREIRKEDERFGQEIGRIYRELPEEERVKAFEDICKPYIERTRALYERLIAGL